ncbi:MAG TPA: 7TM diverse intracellular signaling domain-containing protein, partial [Cytophagaceae bacterium]|nr:7TM diverse intracellular signaling domain-containing protein [Cytophagaceae bacterium]
FSVNEKVYIYYVLYILCGILTTLADDSLGYQYIWFKFPYINSYIGAHIAPTLLLITFILYSREFLHLKKSFPKYDKIIFGVTISYLVYYILNLTILPASMKFRGLYVLPFIAVYLVALKSFVSGYKPARFFIIGYSFIFVGVIIIRLRSNGAVEGNLFTVYSLNYGLILEAIILSYALADRFKYAKKERENALKERAEAQERSIKQLRINEELKDQVNKELEVKVAERTKELFESNIKLKELTDKANQMSIKLDVDNWDLQRKIEESILTRMSGQKISYEEFNKIFPDESACMRYLHKLKWNESYTCRKCRNKESIDEGFTKKCIKCSYLESVSAHTLFHALKFPLNKAFYIAYQTIHKKEKVTLDELSSLLNLRKNTCWKFKDKISSAIKFYQKKNKTDLLKSWEDIIFIDKPLKKNQR